MFLDNAVLDLSEHFNTQFVTRTLSFVASNTTHTVAFAAELDFRTPGVTSVSDRSYYLDNVVLEESVVPEPMAISLLGIGLLGLAQSRRRKE